MMNAAIVVSRLPLITPMESRSLPADFSSASTRSVSCVQRAVQIEFNRVLVVMSFPFKAVDLSGFRSGCRCLPLRRMTPGKQRQGQRPIQHVSEFA